MMEGLTWDLNVILKIAGSFDSEAVKERAGKD
jgi:hypothetical protein